MWPGAVVRPATAPANPNPGLTLDEIREQLRGIKAELHRMKAQLVGTSSEMDSRRHEWLR